jgi:DNA-binding CsgD family transcriptional regulator/tetratricopeptide (TPR) repeat protein
LDASRPIKVVQDDHATAGGRRSASTAIIGRETELARLSEFLGEGEGHEIRALVLTGEPGAGKTTLWEAGVTLARAERCRVLSARASAAEARLSFAALGDLLDDVTVSALEGIPEPQARALEVALVRAEPAGASFEPRAIAAGFLNAVRALARRARVIITVDDIQSLDAPSAEALTFAARRLQDTSVRFLLSRRAGPPPAFERALEPVGIERLDLGPLSFGAIRLLISERIGLALPRRILRQVFDTSRGNPLFALELGRVLADQGVPALGQQMPQPELVEDLFGTKVARLRARIRRTLLAVALSDGLTMPQLVALAGPEAVEECLAGDLLAREGARVRASHPLLAGAAVTHSPPRERHEAHLLLARLVDDEVLRARHLAFSTQVPDADLATTLALGAATARARGAAEDAAALGEHALRLTPEGSDDRAERVLVLGEYLLLAGELQRARDLLVSEVEGLPPGSARARAYLLLSDTRLVVSHVDEWRRDLARALAESRSDPAMRAVVMARRARHAAVGSIQRISDAEAEALEALPAARRAGPEIEREVLHGLAWARGLRGGSIDDLRRRFDAISDHPVHLLRSIDRMAAERLGWRGEVNEAREMLTRLLALADERGEAWSYAVVRLQLCEVELRAGRWDRASDLLDEWDRSAERELLGAPAYERCRALVAAGRGDPRGAERWASAALVGVERSGLRWHLLEVARIQGLILVFDGDLDGAIEKLAGVWDHTRHEGVEEPGVFPVAPDLVEALAGRERLAEATDVTDRLEKLADDQEHPWGLASAKRCRALLGFASGDQTAASMMDKAAEEYERLGLRFDQGRSLLALGRAQRRSKKWGDARRYLEQAVAAFDAMGSPGWAGLVRGELERLPARRPGAQGELTPTERRVAHLAAEGLSNNEIARTLFVSVHTVEAHLAHVFAKLGIRSRSQLAGRLSGEAH